LLHDGRTGGSSSGVKCRDRSVSNTPLLALQCRKCRFVSASRIPGSERKKRSAADIHLKYRSFRPGIDSRSNVMRWNGSVACGIAVLAMGVSAAASSSGSAVAAEVKTLKEQLSDKASDEQRVDNCGVPPERRGPVPRPGCPAEGTASAPSAGPSGPAGAATTLDQ
jgi:hypothetical protein